ncbi:MAG: hypothetical protein HOP12_01765 [Candidatus Eisenbacteria bacterium]|uniref:Uncharacterized protein n=1 Tax=Eiseniibacteriota bacterium TaxID=2212470 RepID=A0A849SEM4_UNCEI|nr:hypothetical protein [Candidatus Eisenbacteria bacterium]
MRVVMGVLAALFAFAAYLNLNDPDPLQWVSLYLASTIAAGWVAWNPPRSPRWLPILVGLAALSWAATLAPQVVGQVSWREMWASWEMKNARIEAGREFYGLLIVASTMALAVLTRRLDRA